MKEVCLSVLYSDKIYDKTQITVNRVALECDRTFHRTSNQQPQIPACNCYMIRGLFISNNSSTVSRQNGNQIDKCHWIGQFLNTLTIL